MLIHLVLKHVWYKETIEGKKRIEYRSIKPYWRKRIWEKRDLIKKVCFSKGYSETTKTYNVIKIDIGTCPIIGWNDLYYRIHFTEEGLK